MDALRKAVGYAGRSARSDDINGMDSASSNGKKPREHAPVDARYFKVSDQLKVLGSRRRQAGNAIDASARLHEVTLRVANGPELDLIAPGKAVAYAEKATRNRAIARECERFGGSVKSIVTTQADGKRHLAMGSTEGAIAFDAALINFERVDARAARGIRLRYFSGLSLKRSFPSLVQVRRKVDRDGVSARFAARRARLSRAMSQSRAIRRLSFS